MRLHCAQAGVERLGGRRRCRNRIAGITFGLQMAQQEGEQPIIINPFGADHLAVFIEDILFDALNRAFKRDIL